MSEEQKIKKKLEEQGLTLEVEVATKLEEKGWLVFQEFPYRDTDGNKIRKSDIFAINSVNDKILLLNIKCKRRTKSPWVFYVKKDDNIAFLCSIISELDSIILNETHTVALSYSTPFTRKDEIYEASNQVIKAIEPTRENTIVSLPKGGEIVSIPLIVFDGSLYQFSSYKTLDLEKVKYIRYLKLDTENSKVIRIIEKDYFQEFLDNHLIHNS